jgi:ATP phosphoribosyltransferase regulatory subunit
MIPRWALPEHIEDVLPAEARRVEETRRSVLDLFQVHGYELVMPPLVEYVDSLLTGTGRDLDLRTFKLVDQLSGRMLGLRADITPQAARIDAHLLGRRGITRLCYAGNVLHALPSELTRTREAIQVGAELYGHAGIESDVEIQQLMLRTLTSTGVRGVHVDLGHIGVFRALVDSAKLDAEAQEQVFRALQAKDLPTLRDLVRKLSAGLREAFVLLPELYGGIEVLRAARRRLPRLPAIRSALVTLQRLGDAVAGEAKEVHFDLGELRGYRYHSGVVFAAYASGWTVALARGGRYDEVGRAFGRARPATGFSLDLRELVAALPRGPEQGRILAPCSQDPALGRIMERLRARGDVVVSDLPGHAATREELGCERELVRENGRWRVRSRTEASVPPGRRKPIPGDSRGSL